MIRDPDLRRILPQNSFDSYRDFEEALPVGREVYVKDGDTVFDATITGFSFSSGNLLVGIRSVYGKGSTSLKDIMGFTEDVSLDSIENSIASISRPISPNLPPPETPETLEEAVLSRNDTEAELEYDEELSRVSYKGFEKTTGQDVKNEDKGELKDDPDTLGRIKLKAEIARDKSRFRYFITAQGQDEALSIVDKSLHDSEVLRLGRPLTEEELKAIALPQTLPLEGKSPLDESDEEDSFFLRNHERRLEIAQEKLGLDTEAAEEFYRLGQQAMKAARLEAHSAPREVKVKEATQGSFTKKKLSKTQLEAKYGPVGIRKVDVADGRKKIGFTFTAEGTTVELPSNPKKTTEVIPAKILEDSVTALLGDTETPQQRRLIESLFISKRNVGKINMYKGRLHFGTNPINSIEEFREALKADPTPSIYNKIDDGSYFSVVDGEIVQVSGYEFLSQFMESEGDLWTHQGRAVPYKSNQVLYLDLSKTRAPSQVPTTREQDKLKVEEVFDDYPRNATSEEKRERLIRDLHPRLFTQRFRRTTFYKRLLAGTKPNNGPIKVGGPFVEKILDLPVLIRGYVLGDMEMVQQGFPLVRSVPYLSIYDQLERLGPLDEEGLTRALKTYDRRIAVETKQEIDRRVGKMLGETPDQNKLKLKRRAANDIANEIETLIAFGPLNDELGISPTTSIDHWDQRATRSSLQSQVSGPYVPSPKIETLKTGSPVMTLDTFREYKSATGEWTTSDEMEYEKELNGNKSSLPTSIKLSHNGVEIDFRVLVPSKLTEAEAVVNRELLLNGRGIGLPEPETVYLQDLKEVKGRANTQEDVDLAMLDSLSPVDSPMFSEEFLYAENILGKNLATALLSKYPDLTFNEIDRFKNYFGKTKITGTINDRFPLMSSEKVKDGSKTITARAKGANNPSGILEIDGEFYDVQFQGNLTMEEVGQRLNLTLNQFLARLTGDPQATTENITQEDMVKFLNGEGSRSIFTIRKLGTQPEAPIKETISCP